LNIFSKLSIEKIKKIFIIPKNKCKTERVKIEKIFFFIRLKFRIEIKSNIYLFNLGFTFSKSKFLINIIKIIIKKIRNRSTNNTFSEYFFSKATMVESSKSIDNNKCIKMY
jgi:hypothetical protein